MQPPGHDGTVHVKLSSLCTATGFGAFCSGTFAVHPGMTVSAKCQAIVGAISDNCGSAGYDVTVNDCQRAASFTASNVGCPGTQFALGISNDSGTFDQTWQGPLPDGEVENTTGTTGSCTPTPAPPANLRLEKLNGGSDLRLTWEDASGADDYIVFDDAAPNGIFNDVVGTSQDGATGLTIPITPGNAFYLVAARNSACGVGSKR